MAIALHHSKATGTAKVIILGIANHDGDGGAWPSIDTLAGYANVTRRNAQSAIRRLQELGEVDVVLQGGGDHSMADTHRPNLYRVLIQCPPNCDRTKNHRTRKERSVDLFITGVSESSPGVDSDALGVSVATPEPSTKPTTRLNKERHHSARESARVTTGPCGHVMVTDRHCDMGCKPIEALTELVNA